MRYKLEIKDTVTINGALVEQFSDDELFEKVSRAREEIARLEALDVDSKKVKGQIADLEAGIKKLIEIVDSRD